MKTSEEIAIKIATQRIGNDYGGKAAISQDAQDWHMIYSACYDALTEQDRIIREQCVKTAQDAHCKLCGKDADYKCYCLTCMQRDEIRKAIEENSSKNY